MWFTCRVEGTKGLLPYKVLISATVNIHPHFFRGLTWALTSDMLQVFRIHPSHAANQLNDGLDRHARIRARAFGNAFRRAKRLRDGMDSKGWPKDSTSRMGTGVDCQWV